MLPHFRHPSIALIAILFLPLLFSGCLVTPVDQSGGLGTVTVTNSNPTAIIAAAQAIFPDYGYTPAYGNGINSISFDKNSNKLANIMWGSYGDPQTIRVKVKIVQIPGTSDYRLSPKVYTISDQGEAGFESKRPLIGLWNAEFGPLLKKVAAQSSGAGPQ
jgi:hypothetical protein